MTGPGVTTSTAIVTGASGVAVPPAGSYFLAGLADRGAVDELHAVTSMADYERKLGPRVSYGRLHDDLRTYFEEGGALAYVARVVGAGADLATRTLLDRAGAPVATLRLDAVNPGAWAHALTVQVANGAANTVTITVRLDGDVVETYVDQASPAAAAAAINATSAYLVATNLASATAAPNNNPAVLAATALAGGDDDRASVTGDTYVAALDELAGPELGAGAVAVPGQSAATVGAGLIAHADTHRRVALLAMPEGTTLPDAIDAAADLSEDGDRAGLFWPWVTIPDGSTSRTIPPEGFVAGVRARNLSAAGPWQAPAGERSAARFVTGTEVPVDRDTSDQANDGRVNPLRVIAGQVRLYGWRSLSTDDNNWRLLTGREVANVLELDLDAALEPYVFETIDAHGRLLARVRGASVGVLAPMARANGLYPRIVAGSELDPGYMVDLSGNTAETAAANEIHVAAAFRVSPTGELVVVTLVKTPANEPL